MNTNAPAPSFPSDYVDMYPSLQYSHVSPYTSPIPSAPPLEEKKEIVQQDLQAMPMPPLSGLHYGQLETTNGSGSPHHVYLVPDYQDQWQSQIDSLQQLFKQHQGIQELICLPALEFNLSRVNQLRSLKQQVQKTKTARVLKYVKGDVLDPLAQLSIKVGIGATACGVLGLICTTTPSADMFLVSAAGLVIGLGAGASGVIFRLSAKIVNCIRKQWMRRQLDSKYNHPQMGLRDLKAWSRFSNLAEIKQDVQELENTLDNARLTAANPKAVEETTKQLARLSQSINAYQSYIQVFHSQQNRIKGFKEVLNLLKA